jgi:hypothetical protein
MAKPGSSPLQEWLSPLIFFSNNWISRLGVILTSAAAVFWIFLLPTYLKGHAGSAYMGILLFLGLPMVFFAGLALIPFGIALQRKKQKGLALPDSEGKPLVSWGNPAFRRLAMFTGFVTFANVLIGANLTYRAVEHMESVQFCGTTCHVVMKPEFTAYQNSPHSKVDCVECHIGPGASWFVQSKLSGAWQLIAVTFNTFERPIPTPVANLRPARDTCEGCHWPDKYGGDRLRVIPHFNDEGVMSRSVLLMRIGGGGVAGKGIHGAHVGKGIRIRYGHSDQKREKIPWVEYQRDGEVNQFLADGTKPEDVSKLNIREMDCVDCHTRPSHTFELPERALDNSMAAGEVVPTLPGMRQLALSVLKKEYASTADGEAHISGEIEKFYREQKPDVYQARLKEIQQSAKGVLAIWERNIFPEMKVTWGTYPNHIGHNDFPGCFRCHDGEHKTAGGKTIEQDCNTCHVMLAMEEEKPKILSDLGLVPEEEAPAEAEKK